MGRVQQDLEIRSADFAGWAQDLDSAAIHINVDHFRLMGSSFGFFFVVSPLLGWTGPCSQHPLGHLVG